MTEDSLESARHSIRDELGAVAVFIGVVWAVFLLDQFLPLERFGLVPRHLIGLVGIVTMTFLHADFAHLLGNTAPLFILLTLLAGSNAQSWQIVGLIIGLGGSLLWILGTPGTHLGASLLISGLVTFLIAAGLFFERRPVSLAIALIVGFLYGIPLLMSVIPRFSSTNRISWDGHLYGAIAGVAIAYLLIRRSSSAAPPDLA